MNPIKSLIRIIAIIFATALLYFIYFFLSEKLNIKYSTSILLFICLNLISIVTIAIIQIKSKRNRIRIKLQNSAYNNKSEKINTYFNSKKSEEIAKYIRTRLATIYSIDEEKIPLNIDLWDALELSESMLKPDVQQNYIFGKYSNLTDISIWTLHTELNEISNCIANNLIEKD